MHVAASSPVVKRVKIKQKPRVRKKSQLSAGIKEKKKEQKKLFARLLAVTLPQLTRFIKREKTGVILFYSYNRFYRRYRKFSPGRVVAASVEKMVLIYEFETSWGHWFNDGLLFGCSFFNLPFETLFITSSFMLTFILGPSRIND